MTHTNAPEPISGAPYSLTRFAVRNRPVMAILLFALMGLGLYAITTLSRREDPDLEGRFVRITAVYPGASVEQVEELVTDKIERAVMELDDLKSVRSTSQAGLSVLQIEVSDQSRNIKKFRDDLRNRVNDALPTMPAGVTSVIVNDRFADTAALIVGVTKDGATDKQREDYARIVRDRLRKLDDVAEVHLVGEQQERIYLTLSSQRMAQLGITPAQVAEAVASRNVLPQTGGSVASGTVRFAIEPSGNLKTPDEIGALVIASPNNTPIYLRDVADITRGYADPPDSLLRVNGKPAVGVYLTMRKGRNITTLGEEVKREFAALGVELPSDVQITLLNDLPRSVEGRMAEFKENLFAGIALILVVMYLFMGLRSAAIVGVMLPITMLGTFALMFVFGRDIQQMSITALIIALGLVVDNSIVVVDNIETKLSKGYSREEAAIAGTDELRLPLLTSNLTTCASFLPMLLLSGGVGEFIRDLGVVTCLATLISLLLNYTVTPLIAIRYLDPLHTDKPNLPRRAFLAGVDRLREGISWLAVRGLRRARVTVALATLALIGAMSLIPKLGTQFFPSAVRNQFLIDVWLPEGRDIQATKQVTAKMEAILHQLPHIESVSSYIGEGSPRFYYNVIPEATSANYAQLIVNTDSADVTAELVNKVQKAADVQIPEARITAKKLEQGPPVGAPIAVRISGDSIEALRQTGEQIRAILSKTPGAKNPYLDYENRRLALKVDVDPDQAAMAGISSADVAQATRMGFTGLTVTNLREGDKEIPVQMRFAANERTAPQSVADLYLPAKQGVAVPLRQVAKVSLVPQEGRILRRNRVRTLTVYAYTDGTRLASQILADARKEIDTLKLPAGITLGYGGEQEEVGRTFSEMLLIFALTIIANLLIVVWEFNGFRAALTILIAVPFSLTGAILGLYLTGQSFGFMAFLGIISLGGVVTNHAIVLFEYALHEQKNDGVPLDQALLHAGSRRLRPILLTVLLSVFGVLPQAVNGGTLWPPMAWALIAGLLMSLILTLVVVPAFYKFITPRDKAVAEPIPAFDAQEAVPSIMA